MLGVSNTTTSNFIIPNFTFVLQLVAFLLVLIAGRR